MRLNEVLPLRWERVDMTDLVFRVDETKTGAPLELPITRQLAAILERRRAEIATLPGGLRDWVFPSSASASGHVVDLAHFYRLIGETGGTKFWYHALRNCFITVAERDLLLPRTLTKRLVITEAEIKRPTSGNREQGIADHACKFFEMSSSSQTQSCETTLPDSRACMNGGEHLPRTIKRTQVQLAEMRSLFHALMKLPSEMIDSFEALIVRAFANDLLNSRMERF